MFPIVLSLLLGCDSDALGPKYLYFVELTKSGSSTASDVTTIANEFGIDPIFVYDSASSGFSAKMTEAVALAVAELPEVKAVTRDKGEDMIDEDPTPIEVGEDEITRGIERIGGPYTGTGDLDAIEVAIVDTGVDANHPDLNVIAEYDAVGIRTGDWADGGDPNGHGTHVAGTVGAIADGSGVAGVAPGVPLHAVRVLDADGSGTLTDIVAGLEYVLDHPSIRVVNMSLGGYGNPNSNDAFAQAIQALEDSGVIVCIAAGNEAADTAGFIPSGYDIGIVVSAWDASRRQEDWAWFTNYGSAVDIAAPGVEIESTWPGGSYAELSGTSMATPHVAGVMAAVLAEDDGLSPEDLLDLATSTGESLAAGTHNREKLIDLDAMLAEVRR